MYHRPPATALNAIVGSLFNRPFTALWSASFITGILNAPLLSLLPVYVEAEIGGTPLFSAGLRSTFLLLGGLFAVPAGLLCDRIGAKSTFLIGVTGTVAAGAVFLTHDSGWLFALCLYIGVAMGFSTTAGQTYLIHAVPRSTLGLGSAAFFLGMTLGNAIGSRLAGTVAEAGGFATVGVWIIGVMAFVFAGLAFGMPEAKGHADAGVRPHAYIREYTALLCRPDVRLLLAVRFLPTCYWGTATLLIPLLVYRATRAVSSAATYAAASLVVAAAFQIAAGRICDAIGPKRPVLIASTGVAVSAFGAGLWTESVAGLYVFGISGAAFAWSVSTMMPRIIHDVTTAAERGRVVGMAHLAWSAGMLTGSLWGGKAVEWDPGLPFYAVTAGCVFTVVLLALLFRRLE